MNKKYSTLLLGIPLLVGMYFLSEWHVDINGQKYVFHAKILNDDS